MLRHQCRRGCCGVHVAEGTGSIVVSSDGVVVLGSVVDGVDGVVVAVVDVVVVVRVVLGAGALPPLPRARIARPQMIPAIRITTVRPHSARTHRLRYHGRSTALKRSVSSMARE